VQVYSRWVMEVSVRWVLVWSHDPQETHHPTGVYRIPRKAADPGVILHQPLSLHIFWFLGLFWPKNERDSCIPQTQKRRTPLPGALGSRFLGPDFCSFLCIFVVSPHPHRNPSASYFLISQTATIVMGILAYIQLPFPIYKHK